jgi:hypothetical protein
LPPGMALGRGLISVRSNRGKKLWKMDRWFVKKHIKEKNIYIFFTFSNMWINAAIERWKYLILLNCKIQKVFFF